MADLSVKYAGLTFKNPLICGSGPNTDGVEMVKAASDAGFGGVVLKSMGYQGWARPSHLRATPRFRVMNRLNYNLRWQQKHGLDNMGIITSGEGLSLWSDQYLEFINDCKRAAGEDVLVGASVISSSTDPSSYAEAIDLFAQSDADFVELDLGYARFYYDPHFSVQVAKKAKQKLSIPVTVKVAPFLTNPTEVIRNYEQAGVDGLCLFDLYYMLDFDINELKLPFRGTYQTYTEGVTLPYTNRCIADARLAGLRVPISASFGVWRWEDVVKCIMSGADTVQICRKVMVRGFEVATNWLDSINKWLDAKGYKTISELKGEILQHIVDFRELSFEVPLIRGGKPSLRSEINSAKCNGCLLCKPACLYFAIKTEDNLAIIDETRCEGCGACVGICPTEAITLVPR